MKCYDVIVVGLGPAGATAAFELSRRGFSVLAIEKATMPRYKPCGGALSAKIENILDNSFKNVVERTIHGICLSFKGEEEIHYLSKLPIAYMVMRDRFDWYLANNAMHAGAKIIKGRVVKLKEQSNKVVVTTDKERYYANMVIGADGVGSVVARNLGLKLKRRFAYLVEGEVKVKNSDRTFSELRFDFGLIPHGYGWVFPKAEHLSVGVGGIGRVELLHYYSEFLRTYIPHSDSYFLRRAILPVFDGKSRISSRRCLLIGDAASLVDPLLGEGIYYAILSARIAAEVMAGGYNPKEYEKRISDEIYSEFSYAKRIATFFYAFPSLMFKLLRHHPEFIKRFIELSGGNLSYLELWKKFKKRALKVPELLRLL